MGEPIKVGGSFTCSQCGQWEDGSSIHICETTRPEPTAPELFSHRTRTCQKCKATLDSGCKLCLGTSTCCHCVRADLATPSVNVRAAAEAMNSKEFYNLMQSYRRVTVGDRHGVTTALKAIQDYIARSLTDEAVKRTDVTIIAAAREEILSAADEQEILLRSWVACMRHPRPSDWENIVGNLCKDTEEHLLSTTSTINVRAAAEEVWRYVIQQCGMGNDHAYESEIAEVVNIISRYLSTTPTERNED